MAVGDVINGYKLTTEWKVVGGMSEIAFAQKGGKDWFIKKFIYPKYPTSDSPGSPRVKEQKRKICVEFENRQKALNGKIGAKCGLGGNLIYAYDFFRCDTCYYKVNEKIDVDSIAISNISHLTKKELLIIMKSLVHSLRILHKEGIVHGDLKPDNILIKKSVTGNYTTKLIDFDDSYFSGSPAEDKESVVGTPEYYSPELYTYISDEDGEVSGKTLTLQSDIFALGIIFTEYITGEKPIISEEYPATYSAVMDGASICFKPSSNLSPTLDRLLQDMMQKEPDKRPTIDEVFNRLKEEPEVGSKESEVPTDVSKSVPDLHSSPKVGLRGRGLGLTSSIKSVPEKSVEKSAPTTPPASKLKGKGLDIAKKS